MKVGKSIQTKMVICPACKMQMDGATPIGESEATPKEGDFSVCIECGFPGIYTADLDLRVPTQAEWEKIDKDVRFWAISAVHAELFGKRRH